MKGSVSTLSNLSRYRLQDEELVSNERVIEEIKNAFDENRCFPFSPNMEIVEGLKSGNPPSIYHDHFLILKNLILDEISKNDITIRQRMKSDIPLNERIYNGLFFVHCALAEGKYSSLYTRRFVLINEKPGVPTIYHISNETTVLSHVGEGPRWQETPSLYLGLNLFRVLANELKEGKTDFYQAFIRLLIVEERAIETGYSHIESFGPHVSRALEILLNEIIRISQLEEEERKEVTLKRPKPFTVKERQRILKLLDARRKKDILNFDYNKNLTGYRIIERYARTYKRDGDTDSLSEIIRLAVAASGHDIHEIRDRANMLLERIFAPKEFDAPLATRFINVHSGETLSLEFSLPRSRSKYFLRLYSVPESGRFPFTEKDISYVDIEIESGEDREKFRVRHQFNEIGQYDYHVVKFTAKGFSWVEQEGTSGRINVLPDIKGELILEIFPDIHGHTRIYWMDMAGHPGLVYNENGEVIRLGGFADIREHLEDLKTRYCISALYLLGVQKRGNNREDWSAQATSPSPFSPVSLVEIEPSLGGESEFKKLISRAHELGIKVIVDIIPHVNRKSEELPESLAVKCYDENGGLVVRASTDGRYGSWNDGKLLNYRKYAIWEWLAGSIVKLIDQFDIDGIRFDSAHAVPIMMKKNNFPYIYEKNRTIEEMVEGEIIVNDREDEHFITTGYYDASCRELIAVPLHYYLMIHIEGAVKRKGKSFFINLAECYWGHERYLSRSGIIPYNSALFKICENIIHGKTDVREIYHIYDNYFPSALSQGTELLGILGNHDERRALNTFGQRGLRAAVGISVFMSNIIMDYEGSAEGEGWKVFLDNIYVNWNQFEYASHRSVERFYREWFEFHRKAKGIGYLLWCNNNMVVASMKVTDDDIWIGAFNFSEQSQNIAIQFDNPRLPIEDSGYYELYDTIYSPITTKSNYFTGRELKVSKIFTMVSFTERVKLFKLHKIPEIDKKYPDFLTDSFFRLCSIDDERNFPENFAFQEILKNSGAYNELAKYLLEKVMYLLGAEHMGVLKFGIKRSLFHLVRIGHISPDSAWEYIELMTRSLDEKVKSLGDFLNFHNREAPLVFMSAEAEPFSKSGGLANVVGELPRELAAKGEEVYVISGYYRNGDEKSVKKMRGMMENYGIKYTGVNVRFKIMESEYEVGVHSGDVEGVTYFLLDHYEFFDGLYWGFTAEEKLRRRIAFARAAAELIITFRLNPLFVFTNDAFTGLFNGLVRTDPVYYANPVFARTTFLHVIHNGGWQYFDAYNRYENGFDLFSLFNLPGWKYDSFADPVFHDRINCMATGIRSSDRVITVSPTYAKQIEFASDGMEHLLHNVIGISNAIGKDFIVKIKKSFNESEFTEKNYEPFIEHIKTNSKARELIDRDYPEILQGMHECEKIKDPMRRYIVCRMRNKVLTQFSRNLPVDPKIVLFTMIHRITEQKGFQLLLEASEGLFKYLGMQAIIGGAVSSGDKKGEEIAHGLFLMSRYYPEKVSLTFGFQNLSIPLLSSDLFCMPSMNEPGGISQLEAFAAGCMVVARATGGLRDTVAPLIVNGDSVEGNGFLFTDYQAGAFFDAMRRAAFFFKENREDLIYRARINAEKSVYFWDKPALKYIEKIYNIKEIIRKEKNRD